MNVLRGVLVLGGLLCAACSLRNDFFVHDTEGWDYRASCGTSECRAEVDSPNASHPRGGCAGGARAGFALAGRGVLVACHACVGAGAPAVDAESCRALTCSVDHDCPPFHGATPTRCVRGLCEMPSQRELDLPAAMGLCMAGAGPSGGAPLAHAADRVAMARAACDARGVCGAPQGCREP